MTTAREPMPTMPEKLRLMCHLLGAAMVLTWIINALPYPARFGTIVTSAAAVLFASLGLWFTAGIAKAMFLRMVLIVGGVIALVTAVSSTTLLLLAPELIAQSQCEGRALTQLALDQCHADFNAAVEAKLGVTVTR